MATPILFDPTFAATNTMATNALGGGAGAMGGMGGGNIPMFLAQLLGGVGSAVAPQGSTGQQIAQMGAGMAGNMAFNQAAQQQQANDFARTKDLLSLFAGGGAQQGSGIAPRPLSNQSQLGGMAAPIPQTPAPQQQMPQMAQAPGGGGLTELFRGYLNQNVGLGGTNRNF